MSFDFNRIQELYESIRSGTLFIVNKKVLQYRKILELANLWDYSSLRSNYWQTIHDIILDYLAEPGSIVAPKNLMKSTISQFFYDAAVQAYRDTGAELPLDEDTISYMSGMRDGELGYVDSLFSSLSMIKKEEKSNARFIAPGVATQKADGYAHTLDSLYANVKLLAKPNVMLTFSGSDGFESCSDCRRLKNKRHRAKWWVAHEAVPPSRHFECKGYRCHHHLVDDEGRLYTI